MYYVIDPKPYARSSCKGHFMVNDRYTLFVAHQLYDTHAQLLDHIFDNISVVSETDTGDEKIFVCEIKNVKTYLELNIRTSMIHRDISYLCYVNNANYKYLPPRFNKMTASETIFDVNFIDNLIKYLHNINADFLYYENDDIIIYPDIVHCPIDKSDVDNFEIAQTMIYDTAIYDYFSKIQFYVFQKNITNIAHLLTLSNENIIQLLERNKNMIYDFYRKNGLECDDIILNIYISRELDYKYFIIKCDIINNIDGAKYISFIDNYRWMSYYECMMMLKHGLYGFEFISKFYNTDSGIAPICKGEHFYDLMTNINKLPSVRPWHKTLLGGGNILSNMFPNYQVVNYFHRPTVTKEAAHCINAILIKTVSNEFWEIIFRSNYFEKARTNDNLEKIINRPYDFSDNESFKSFIDYTTWYGTCTIRKLVKQEIPFRISLLETKKDADIILHNFVSGSPKIDNSIVIAFAFLTKQFDNQMISHPNPLIRAIATSQRYFSQNFYVSPKRTTDRHAMSIDVYRIWYYPQITIKNSDKFIQMLSLIQSDWTYDFLRTNQECYQMITESTNFYDLYRDTTKFVYNSRYLTTAHKMEIKTLLNKFIYFTYFTEQDIYHGTFDMFSIDGIDKYINPNKFRQYFINPYLSWTHYPNQYDYNVFHLHIARMKHPKHLGESILSDRMIRYQLKDDRAIGFDFLDRIDLSHVDIKINCDIKYSINDDIESIIVKLKNFILDKRREILLNNINEKILYRLAWTIQKYKH